MSKVTQYGRKTSAAKDDTVRHMQPIALHGFESMHISYENVRSNKHQTCSHDCCRSIHQVRALHTPAGVQMLNKTTSGYLETQSIYRLYSRRKIKVSAGSDHELQLRSGCLQLAETIRMHAAIFRGGRCGGTAVLHGCAGA